ncbi:hypothetical protein SAMN04488029_1006 [Reichenbachiella faecimaris]|uniref:DUF1579 domain-containing protein n=1 Tax=Reichenbachiella faecimaris TaxID=692418 RepID=A0A1W2G8N7_REIFA|nr:hypothetical protein [Reichenbachiella faecimaris]SMD32656.1 hypothetical protein SAMN04488029_1006 [Reichenbachiella faecimaris]
MQINKLIFLSVLFLASQALISQPVDKYGFADPSIPELAQFEYYRGIWQAELEMKQEDGSFKRIVGGATIVGRFLGDHKTFQSQFTTSNGFFSTDIRSYNLTTRQWEALFLNANDQRWHHFTSQLINGKMTTTVLGGYSGKETFDIKVTDTILSDTTFHKDVYQSTDDMKTWVLTYKIDLIKVSE